MEDLLKAVLNEESSDEDSDEDETINFQTRRNDVGFCSRKPPPSSSSPVLRSIPTYRNPPVPRLLVKRNIRLVCKPLSKFILA